MLIGSSRAAEQRWVRGPMAALDVIDTHTAGNPTRIVVGGLERPEQAHDVASTREWLRGSDRSAPFDGRTPLALMSDEGGVDGLVEVCRLLDALAAGGTVEPNDVDRDFEPYGEDEIVFLDRMTSGPSGADPTGHRGGGTEG